MIPEVAAMRIPSISPALLALAAVAAGIAGSTVAVANRDPGEATVLRQQRLQPLLPEDVEAAVVRAPNALPGAGDERGRSARCTSRGTGALKNPWSCLVTYPSGQRVRYRVIVAQDRSFRGASKGNALVIQGCCAGSPG